MGNKNFVKKAFSLLELSIVILVLGLLVAGIAQGGRLMAKMRLASARSFTQASTVAAIPGLTLWLDATAEKSFDRLEADDGQLITNWYDVNPVKSKLTLSQSGSLRPTYVLNAINGLPAVSFNSTNLTRLNTASAIIGSELFSPQEVSVFIVQKFMGGSSTTIFWENGSRLNVHAYHGDSSSFYFDYGVCCASTGRISTGFSMSVENGKVRVFAITKKSNGTAEVRRDGVSYLSSSGMTGTLSTSLTSILYVGNSSGAHYFNGYIAEIIIYNRAVTAEERLEIEQYLGKKWGVKIT